GVSRSGLTIAAALGLGFSREWAVGFSLLLAVPAILGATAFELKHVNAAVLTTDRVAQIVAATVVAGLVGYVAIPWLVRGVRARSPVGPARLSEAGVRAALGEAIGRTRREGRLDAVATVADAPGFRRRLRRRIASWTLAELDPRGEPPGEGDLVTAAEWAV